jgi:hypothetical protein
MGNMDSNHVKEDVICRVLTLKRFSGSVFMTTDIQSANYEELFSHDKKTSANSSRNNAFEVVRKNNWDCVGGGT